MSKRFMAFNGPAPIAMPQGLVQSTARPFFNRGHGRAFDVHAAGDVTEIELYEEIGFWGVTAAEFRQQLAKAKGGDVVLKINSPGGDVFDGIAIFNDLAKHPGNVSVEVTGIAASAASLIAMAGDTITVASNAFLMIHNAWTIALGDKRDMTATAEVLAQIDGALADTYVSRTGVDRAEVVQMMDDETWMNGAEAVARGFANSTGAAVEAKARFDLSCFAKAPAALRAFSAPAGGPTIRDTERALRDAGHSRAQAKTMAARIQDADPQRDAAGDADDWAALAALVSTIAKGKQR